MPNDSFAEMANNLTSSWARHTRELQERMASLMTSPVSGNADTSVPLPSTTPPDLAAWGPQALLRMAIAQGLKESDAREIFAEHRSALKQSYLEVAQATRHAPGDVEVDDDAAVSFRAHKGAYVQAWVWVDIDELPAPASLMEALGRLRENGITHDALVNGQAVAEADMRTLEQGESQRCDDTGRLWRLTDGRVVTLVLKD